jgi:YihY family inner membrane protein
MSANSASSASTANAPDQRDPSRFSRIFVEPWKRMLRTRGVPTLRYLAKTEAHTFAFSVAANAILSFFPFMVLIMWLIRNVFHSQNMADIVVQLLRDHLPAGQEFVIRNLNSLVKARKGVKVASLVILFITSTGVFLPLEVALNQIWGFTKNRSYVGNQLISLLLAFASGILALASVGAAAGNQAIMQFVMLGQSENIIFKALATVALTVFATLASILIFFLIYWLLPNGKVRPRSVLLPAVAMGVLWEIAKYAYMKALPWLDFNEVYGPFSISVTLMFWAFLSGLMLLAGAHLAAEFAPQRPETER